MIDAKLLFGEDQVETTVAAHNSTNVIDLGALKDHLGNTTDSDPGEGGGLWLNVLVTEAVTSGGAATVASKLQDSPDNSAWSDTELGTGAIAKASLTAGTYMIRQPLPTGLQRYLKVVYTIGTAVLTAGKFTAWVSKGPGQTS